MGKSKVMSCNSSKEHEPLVVRLKGNELEGMISFIYMGKTASVGDTVLQPILSEVGPVQ